MYRESYTLDKMAYWENPITHERPHNVGCRNISKRSLIERNINISYKNMRPFYEEFGKCMHDKGFIFKTTNWLYCYHRKEECKVYDKYRN